MDKFTNDQKRIALALAGGPKTIDELNKGLGMPFDVLSKELKELLNLKLAVVEGYPSKYHLKKEIINEIKRRKEVSLDDSNPLRLKIIIDVQALVAEAATKSLNEVEKKLKADNDFTIYDIFKAEPIKHEEYFTSYLEINLSVKDFKSLVKLMYFFGPTSLEVLKPKKFEIPMSDLQDGLMDMAEMIQSYNMHILKSMRKDDLERFQRKMMS